MVVKYRRAAFAALLYLKRCNDELLVLDGDTHALLAFVPWLFVIKRRVYGRSLTAAEAQTELPNASRIGGLLNLTAVALIAISMAGSRLGPGSRV